MPRRQRFKPNRKKTMDQGTQPAAADRDASPVDAASLEPGPRETERDEIHPDDVEVVVEDEGRRGC